MNDVSFPPARLANLTTASLDDLQAYDLDDSPILHEHEILTDDGLWLTWADDDDVDWEQLEDDDLNLEWWSSDDDQTVFWA